ncbi:MAG: CDP-alcohol phosphatidyltransferase family protein [Nanoarchaeota archaeon]|nr:CDP-alcohol phosphatidyltransferase family protein [Nanoarchaeota archaeon]
MKKPESIKELRKICQPEYKEVKINPYYRIYRRFFRIFSIYITKWLLYFNLSANLISVMAIIFGLMGSLSFYYGKFLLGALIMQLWFLGDTLDGELARYYYHKHKQKNYLIKGEFLDLNSHHLVHPLVFIGLSLGLYNLTNNINMVYLGIAVLFALLFNELIDLNKIKVLFYEGINVKTKLNIDKIKEKRNLLKKLRVIYTFPSIINIILIATIFDRIYWVFLFYGFTFPIIVLLKLLHNLMMPENKF